MSLTSIPETFLAGKNAVVTLGTVTGLDVMDGSYKIEVSSDDMTNSAGLGWYQDVATIAKATGTLKLAYAVSMSVGFVEGSIYAMIIDVPNGPYFSASVRINSSDTPVANVKGGITVSFSFTSQGPVTRVRPV